MEWRITLITPIAGLLLLGLACQSGGGGGGGPQGEGQPTGDPAELEAGRLIYQQSCAGCHGTPGAADGSAPDLNNASANELQATLESDRHPGGAHAPLGDDELVQLSTYLEADGAAADSPDTPSVPDVPQDPLLPPTPQPVGHPCDPCMTASDRAVVAPTLEQMRGEGVTQADAVIQLGQAMINVGVDPGVCPGCAEAMVAEAYEGAAPDPTPGSGTPVAGPLDDRIVGSWRYEWSYYDSISGFNAYSYIVVEYRSDGSYYELSETCAEGGTSACSDRTESFGNWTADGRTVAVTYNDGSSFWATYEVSNLVGDVTMLTQSEGTGDPRLWYQY